MLAGLAHREGLTLQSHHRCWGCRPSSTWVCCLFTGRFAVADDLSLGPPSARIKTYTIN